MSGYRRDVVVALGSVGAIVVTAVVSAVLGLTGGRLTGAEGVAVLVVAVACLALLSGLAWSSYRDGTGRG